MENQVKQPFPVFSFLLDIRGWVEAMIRVAIAGFLVFCVFQLLDIRIASRAELGTEYQDIEAPKRK